MKTILQLQNLNFVKDKKNLKNKNEIIFAYKRQNNIAEYFHDSFNVCNSSAGVVKATIRKKRCILSTINLLINHKFQKGKGKQVSIPVTNDDNIPF
jgi:hypothetical protein